MIGKKIGFMQGRMSPLIDGKIQAFPTPYWRDEFALAKAHGWHLVEWTLDHEGLDENPLMNVAGRREIRSVCEQFGCAVPSLTGDFFMQAPFFKFEGKRHDLLLDDLKRVLVSCAGLNIRLVMLPLVDDGKIENNAQEDALYKGLDAVVDVLKGEGMRVSFESDFDAPRLAKFIAHYDPGLFGITYDIGNSAALGYDFLEEFDAYGSRIDNVHVKDRVLGGTTVPLGKGNADLPGALQALKALGYEGHYILQTARAKDDDHVGVLNGYRDQVVAWLGCGTHGS